MQLSRKAKPSAILLCKYFTPEANRPFAERFRQGIHRQHLDFNPGLPNGYPARRCSNSEPDAPATESGGTSVLKMPSLARRVRVWSAYQQPANKHKVLQVTLPHHNPKVESHHPKYPGYSANT
jgi:hypothetical protein